MPLFDASPALKAIGLKRIMQVRKEPFEKSFWGGRLFKGNYSQIKKIRAQQMPKNSP